jgi:3-oxoacyl-[acyl-carrier-protein] synthase III
MTSALARPVDPGRAETRIASRPLAFPVGILGVGTHVPSAVVTNDDLAGHLDTSDEWIVRHTGIRERRYLDDGMSTSDMCIAAARRALDSAGTRATDIDAILLGTITPDRPLPSTALVVREALGARNALPLDFTQLACAGGVYGILVASQMMQSGQFRNVLVIGADSMSRITDPADRTTRVFFGDAAGAVVLGPTRPGYGLLAWDVEAELSYEVQIPAGGAQYPTSPGTVAAGGQFLKMNGRAVWDVATTVLPRTIVNVLANAGLQADEIAHFVLHQANHNIIKEVMQRLDAPLSRARITVDRLGNTGSASIFTALGGAIEDGDIRHDDHMVLAGIGAGFLWGALCLRHYAG